MSIQFSKTIQYIRENTGVDVSFQKTEDRGLIDWEAVRTLKDIGIISHQYGVRYIYVFESSNGEEIARIEFAVFNEDSVGYIHWLKVNGEYQEQGIGTQIRKQVVDFLEEQNESIYSKTRSPVAASIAKNQGFSEIQYSDLEGWYLKE